VGTAPFSTGPDKAANNVPAPPGLGDGLGLPVGVGETVGDGELVGVGETDGEGLPFGVGETDGEGEPLGVGETDGDGLPFGVGEPDGEGEPFGLPLGLTDGLGEGLFTPKTPLTRIVAPLRTSVGSPLFTVGTICPSCVRRRRFAPPNVLTVIVPTKFPLTEAVRLVPAGRPVLKTSYSSSRRPSSLSRQWATPFALPPFGELRLA